MHFLGGEQRKTGGKIKAQLRTEDADRAGAGAITFGGAVVEHLFEQVEIEAHDGVIVVGADFKADSLPGNPGYLRRLVLFCVIAQHLDTADRNRAQEHLRARAHGEVR